MVAPFNFTPIVAIARTLIQKYGQAVTLQIHTDGALPDADKPWEPGEPTFTDYATFGAIFPVEESLIDQTTIKAGDQVAYLGISTSMPTDLQVTPLDYLEVAGERRQIVRAQMIAPSGKTLLIIAVLKR